ncbi:MAG: hypothetical protein NTY61_00605, partial [Candidatus Parcubacteria bacterium]|nr:hypothetical protein [Candidatus Parcubacteria bacterium]
DPDETIEIKEFRKYIDSLDHFYDTSTNPVPFILVGHNYKKVKLAPGGILGDVAPTILELKNVAKPSDIRGKSLILSTHGKN